MRYLPYTVLTSKGIIQPTRGVGSARWGRGAVENITWVHPSYPWVFCVPVPSYDTIRSLSYRE